MTTITRTLTVNRPIEEVFQYMADFSTTEQWDPNVLRADKLTPGPPKPGSEFSLLVKSSLNKLSMNYRVTELKPNTRIQLEGQGESLSLLDTIELESLASKSTKIQYVVEVDLKGMFGQLIDKFPKLLNPMIDSAISGLERALNNEKETIKDASKLADKLIIPGMLKFTRLGHQLASQRWKGLAVNLSGKQAVVTGATSGLGRETALALAKMGADVLVVVRDVEKAEALSEFILLETGKTIETVIADLSMMADTLRAADQIKKKCTRLDILVNNAGALFNQRETTSEHLEKSFALLLLSPFVLTEALMPMLKQPSDARVINVSSGGMYTQKLVLKDLQYEQEDYDGPKAYARAKRGLVDITEVWARQHQASNISFNAMHPGWADTPAVATSLPDFYKTTKPVLRTPREGADTIIWLAAAEEVKGKSGQFWLDRQPHTTSIFPATQTNPETQEALFARLKALADEPVSTKP